MKHKDYMHEGIFKIPEEVLENSKHNKVVDPYTKRVYCTTCESKTMHKFSDEYGHSRKWCSRCGLFS